MKKKLFKYTGILLLSSFVIFNGWILLAQKQFVYKAIYYNFANIDDYEIFPERPIWRSSFPIEWPNASTYNQIPLSDSLQDYLEKTESVALLIIQNDSVVRESYWHGYEKESMSNSFSMAKSYISALIGVALQEGKIKSIDQAVCDYLPDFCHSGLEKITIQHLLTMSSGLEWQEGYASPFSPTTEAYYGNNLRRLIGRLRPAEEPGKTFRYQSCDTQVLAFVLEAATGKKISDYAYEKLWEPLGCERDALWSLDHQDGDEKAYCCLNSNARDFAKLGKLYLDSGQYNGKQLLPKEYVTASLTPHGLPDGDKDMAPSDFYGYQWWLIPDYQGRQVFYARGILGQYIIVVPSTKTIVVRLGKKRGAPEGKHYKEIFLLLKEVLPA
jgi:CubicO group peptidase (beta-lactamase class C family)